MSTKFEKSVNQCTSQNPHFGDCMVQVVAKNRFEKSLPSFRSGEDLDGIMPLLHLIAVELSAVMNQQKNYR